jgi:hypothetical protein
LRHLWRNLSQEKIESSYQEAKGNGPNCRTDPGEKGSFNGGVGRLIME